MKLDERTHILLYFSLASTFELLLILGDSMFFVRAAIREAIGGILRCCQGPIRKKLVISWTKTGGKPPRLCAKKPCRMTDWSVRTWDDFAKISVAMLKAKMMRHISTI